MQLLGCGIILCCPLLSNMEESTSLIPLVERLPRDLFIHICSFISLYEKCAKLTSLSRSTSVLYDVHACCIADTLSADLDVTFHQWISAIRAGYFQREHILGCWALACSVRSIEIEVSRSYEPAQHFYRQQILSEIRAALALTRLRSLSINETLSSCSFANDVICSLSLKPNVRLNHLQLSFYAEESDITIHSPSFRMDWSGLLRFQELTSFVLNAGDGVQWSIPQQVCSQLPASVTSLEIQSYWDGASISELLLSPNFLPHLEVLILKGNQNLSCGAELSTITTTTKVRPLRVLKGRVSPLVQLAPFVHLTDIDIALYEDGISSIFNLPEDSLPLLRSFQLATRSFAQSIDFKDMAKFLSFRPIVHLKLDVWFENDSQCLIGSETISYLSHLAALESLYVLFRTEQAQPVFIDSNIDKWLPVSCWPRLSSLKLMRFPCSPCHLKTMLAAAPALGDFTCTSSNITVSEMLAMAAMNCVCIKKVKLVSLVIPRLHDAQQHLHNIHFDNSTLKSCDIVGWGLCPITVNDATLHYLLDKLSTAPCLVKFRESYSPSRLRAYLQHKLPHIKAVVLPDHIFSNERNSVTGRRSYSTSDEPPFFTLTTRDRYEFNPTLDSLGLNGRQAFFHALFDSLCVADRQRVRDWEHQLMCETQ